MKIKNNNARRILPILLFIIISEIVVRLFYCDNVFVPPPSLVFKDLIVVNYHLHLKNLLSTLYIILIGLIPAILIGWFFALLFYEYKKIGNLFKPIIDSTQLIPKTALSTLH